MTPEDFKQKWTSIEDNLNPISAERLRGLGLCCETIEFLVNSGLPDSASPFLSFSENSEDLFDGVHKLNKVYDILEPEFEKYVVIGSCSDGDPIVVNTKQGDRIEFLDHEDYFSSRIFNSDISRLAKCLLAYRNFVDTILEENGEDAYLDSDFTDDQFEKLKDEIQLADSKAMENGAFWAIQLQMDLDLREETQNNK
ncbi:SUKH-4 family immunity protein [Flagellimonas marinaquae]|uniref:SUKH-4 family immunity protein n=1 Tax=Flagellimonas marinaquae TaxID=254955 RepID=UPI002075F74D|nr:SUKH-4 family immunity protein [Allomuricauda aquimarina]USD25793.1 SUKH-4 family immunity protein [Allomuricauda aquimarina]